METTAKETIEKELNRRLESMRDDLEEKWVQKMRSQEVELRHQHDVERIEYQTQLEQQCHQQVEALKHENHIAFIKAVRQMKKSLAQNKKHQRHTAEYQGKQPEKGLSEDWTDASSRTASQAADESLVEQLHKENQLESIKQKHEAEMASLRQQLEEYRQISEKNHEQLQEQYLQAVTSLRNGLAQAQQGELDAVVRQLQELHEQQLKQLQAQHQHDLELEVVAVRVAVEQVQNARVHLIQEEHEKHLQHLKKEHKDQLNALHAELDNLHAGDRQLTLTASEELTRRYQQLIEKITKSLENQMLTFKHEDYVAKKAEKKDQAEESGSPEGIITAQQAEAIQEALQAQQEEVLFLRSELLAEYEHLLQQRSAEATQQTQDVLRLQEEMAALQQQYQKQINEFQARLSNLNEQKGMQGTGELQQDLELENVKATYEQRITDLEDSFTRR
ncbi:involucrin-like [Pomacea canaliculata]|uniref:involucrin-like n=1 Tax=Pomacea canaliculata TaxID=400727 RepID=UPI000D72CC5D|nr:involucrin-like [Pomacea canaliculata]